MVVAPDGLDPTEKRHLVYDAWSRLVGVRQDDGGLPGALIVTYRYNGLGHRVTKLLGSDPENPDTTTHYYYNAGWQVVEERRAVGAGPAQVHTQYLWCPSYIDTPVLRWRDTPGSGNQTLNEALYYTVDANKNVTALVEPGTSTEDGTVVERYLYDPYGRVTFLKPDWSPQEVTGHDDGAASAFGNEILFTGYRYNPETGTYHARNREYHPTLGRFMQRDPLGYVDGGNLYAGYFVMWGGVDPMGLSLVGPDHVAEISKSPSPLTDPFLLSPSTLTHTFQPPQSIWSPVPSYPPPSAALAYPPTVPTAPLLPIYDAMSNSLIYPGLAGNELPYALWSETPYSLHDLALSLHDLALSQIGDLDSWVNQYCECLSKRYGVELDLSMVRRVDLIPPTAPIPWSEVLDVIQTGLDVGGLVPVAGIFCDIPNAAIYLARGDFLNAGLSGAAAIPIAGASINSGRLAAKGVDAAASAPRRPANLSPEGAGRGGALRQALRDHGVPTSQQPSRVLPNVDRQGRVRPGRVYEYDVPAPGGGTRTVRIRDDATGHNYGPRDPQNRGPHFNDPSGVRYDY